MVETIGNRVAAIREKIERSAGRVGRDPSEVALMAVTKTRTAEDILNTAPFVDAIGENRVQETAFKKEKCADFTALEWRLIGHLQSNKIRKALALFDALDSLDSAGIAVNVERVASETGRVVPVLIEVNTSGEASKTGIAPENFPELLERVLECGHLRLYGLMTVGPLTDDEAEVRRAFALLREVTLKARVRSGLPLPVLSMGMSEDFELAVLEGSTMVRIGTSLFGPRK